MSTAPDPLALEWALTDNVVRLREWGTDRIYGVSAHGEITIGATDDATVRLRDPSGRMSRRHAVLVRQGDVSFIRDAGSTNGIRIDGAARPAFVVAPGTEVSLGGVTLIAESPLSIALRRFLARILGWSTDRTKAVDLALRAVRMAATGRCSLYVSSESDPVAIAYEIHRLAMGSRRPFIACDPRRRAGTETVRSVRNVEDATLALEAAIGGSLCVWSSRLPKDFTMIRSALYEPDARVTLVVCSTGPTENDTSRTPAINVPALATRRSELTRIIDEYAEDARMELAADREAFRQSDRTWIAEHASSSLSEIETATLRLVALRRFGNVNRAAIGLGMAHVSLARWILRRGAPWRD